MRTFLFSIIVAVASSASAALPADTILSLEQCQEMAVSYNASLRNATNSVKMAGEMRKEAFTKYFPEISATGFGFIANHDMLQYDLDLPMLQELGFGGVILGLVKKGIADGVQALRPVWMGGEIVTGNRLACLGV